MGRVVDEVQSGHLAKHPHERRFLTPFLGFFDITWAARHVSYGSTVSVYFLKPEIHTTQTFGFEREVLLVYSPYTHFEPRLVQLVDRFLTSAPAKLRVESLCFMLVSDDLLIRENVTQVTTSSVEAKTIVPFARLELENGPEPWLVHNRLAEHLFSRDLFDISQALIEDTYFFGRQTLAQDLLDRFRLGQNTGLFGLRKTGKTSMISNLTRRVDASGLGFHVVLDAQDPAIYKQRWWELLGTIVSQIGDRTGLHPTKGLAPFAGPDTAAGGFSGSLNYVFARLQPPKNRILLIIDEFEHVSPGLSLSAHWSEDYLPFWQTIRAYQTRVPTFCCLVAGVNPSAAEKTRVSEHDNPLFSLIPRLFMPSFSRAEVRDMVRTLGRYMGMQFEEETYEYLRARYGGHPMLIRLACSWMHKHFTNSSTNRPFKVSLVSYRETEAERDGSLAPYARHILDVLTTWYPLEYEMLAMLCRGHIKDYEELASQEPELRQHLQGYGLVETTNMTSAANGMIADYIRRTAVPADKRGDSSPPASPKEAVQVWTAELEQLSDAVVHSRAYCQELAQMAKITAVFADDKLRIGAKLADLRVTPVSASRGQFESAVNTLQQLFWDSISTGERANLENRYPALFDIVNKIRCL
jgi:hypothetical protein